MAHAVTRQGIARGARAAAVALSLALACALAAPAAAATLPAGSAFSRTQVTLSETSGGAQSRFTFIAGTVAEVDEIDLTFPGGFDLGAAKADAVMLEGLNRVPVTMTHTIDGQMVRLAFDPPVAAGATLRVQVHEVKLPSQGGTHALQVAYRAADMPGTVPPLGFKTETVTTAQIVSRWLDTQDWVRAWNSVDALKLFTKPQIVALAIPLLFTGWLTSIALVGLAFPLAIAGGLALAFARMAKIPPVRWIAGLYINVIRGTPLFLQIYIAFVGLPIAGIRAPLFLTGVIVLALNSSAYLAEIFRAGIQSIHRGQFEAASSLGMTYWQAMQHVVVPQTVKRVLPTMTSEFILLFKDTALLSAIGIFELMLYSNSIATDTGNLTPFVVAAVYYLIVTIPLINWVGKLEAKLALSEGGQAPPPKNKRGGLFWRPATRGPIAELEVSAEVHESR